MKNVMMIILVIIFCNGCTPVLTRLEQYKNQNSRIATVELTCDIPTAKHIVRQVIKEVNLAERPKLEKPDFIFADTGYGNYWKGTFSNALLIPANYARIGFFFNQGNNITTITIAEDIAKPLLSSENALRYQIADKIKLKSIKEK